MASIVITGLAANDPVPGTYVEVAFAQGDASGASADRSILLMGNMTTAGAATADTVIYGPDTAVPLQTEENAIALFGAGSELHRMFRRVTKVNQVTSVYAIAVTESGGTAASTTVVLATNASGSGTLTVYVGDESVDVGIVTGDTPTVIGDALVLAVNAMTHWPVTAANSSGTVTFTAKIKGPRGNWLRIMARITAGIGTTTTKTADTFFTSGATADVSTTALATISTKRFYRIVSAADDATQLGALLTQVNLMAAPTTGMRQRVFAGSITTLAATNTIATGLNGARAEIAWQKNGPVPPSELAANLAAIVALFEDSGQSPRCNFAGFGNDELTSNYWHIKASRDSSAWPTRADIKSALNNGVSPIGLNSNGTTFLVNRVTTRSLSGATADYRIRDPHKVTICDFFGDDIGAKTTLNFSGKKLASDPPKGARPPGPDVVTPGIWRGSIFGLIDLYDFNDLLQDVALIKSGTIVQREVSPTSRISARIPLRPIDCAFQFGVFVAQVA
jgi:phage tail sheath gpL-like